ncbi:MAG: hypothetical protein EU532_00875 [Promethearchaeota archaeon]|nr:MAG: hypothetical protein EU532_00875 [Candidatus Lokiarchaeota archaeon]
MAEREQYKYESLIKVFVILGGIIGLLTQIFALAGISSVLTVIPHWWGASIILILIVGIVISVLTILCGLRKETKSGNEIVPFHWISFLILAILLILFGGGIIACVLLIIAFILALIDDLV